MATLDDLQRWMTSPKETEHLEFKEAKAAFDKDKLVKYCAALANEGGGQLVLGVSDKVPRKVVGSTAFADLGAVKLELMTRLRLRIDAEELHHADGRVVVFTAPSRPIGTAVAVDGAYWMRAGESLVAMTPDQLKRIFDEGVADFSATTVPGATLADLDDGAVEVFKAMWERRQPPPRARNSEQLLEDAELLVDGQVTVAAMVLFGTRRGLGRYLAQSELIFEYRSEEDAISSAQRVELRQGFLAIHDELWRLVNLRNTVHQFVQGLFRTDIPAVNERAFREAILNAVCHRDYRMQGSIFVKQWPSRVEITSPGGFPPGITLENILSRQAPRNRRLAEAFGKCGLVERSGQGVDLLFETAVREGKQPLDFAGTDAYQVRLTLHGRVEDEGFLRFLAQVNLDLKRALSLDDLQVLNAIRRDAPVPKTVQARVSSLVDLGLIERAGKARLVLARKYYRVMGTAATYTRRRGLDRETNKALLMKHIAENPGVQLAELCEVLPSLSAEQVRTLLRQLKQAGEVHIRGLTKAGRWYPGAGT